MSKLVEELKTALAFDHNKIITGELTEEQALKIANDLHQLGRKPTDQEVYDVIKKYYNGELLSSANESRDQARTNTLQKTILKMIQSQKK
ncbi:hypothetical protein SB6411_02145 [Klebsiella spallanzanii]|uniref:Uncharacterized protein n=1 Tax=Klebsiella spallanzanii TaxID=2587528 RepID=A0ABY6VER0_9ENTR|nr:hypothetical protein [Klebsiella spallanzanii]VUS66169.1 hypothetical protein SB6411_02145 [Klebsiella spallanzanii]